MKLLLFHSLPVDGLSAEVDHDSSHPSVLELGGFHSSLVLGVEWSRPLVLLLGVEWSRPLVL